MDTQLGRHAHAKWGSEAMSFLCFADGSGPQPPPLTVCTYITIHSCARSIPHRDLCGTGCDRAVLEANGEGAGRQAGGTPPLTSTGSARSLLRQLAWGRSPPRAVVPSCPVVSTTCDRPGCLFAVRRSSSRLHVMHTHRTELFWGIAIRS